MAPEQISLSQFEASLPSLLEDILNASKKYDIPAEAEEWFSNSLKINAAGGKCNRGMSVHDTVVELVVDGRVGEERYNQSVCLGWMIELLQSFFLVSDDIMDSSITRRGQDCWYRRPGVGMIAINDAFLLESALYVLLKKYFRSHPSYVDLLELFHEVTLQTELGQLCDLITAPEDDVDLSKFSIAKYTFIAVYKTAYYSFYLPVALALHLLQLATPKNLQQSRDILLMMGEYFQVQDDYLDNFGQPEQIGKVGTDIEDNKCSWLINQALLRVSPEQRQVLDANYGSRDKSNVAAVKKVYDELKLEQVYEEYEEKVVGDLRRLVDGVDESEGLKKGVFESFLKKIYRRSK